MKKEEKIKELYDMVADLRNTMMAISSRLHVIEKALGKMAVAILEEE